MAMIARGSELRQQALRADIAAAEARARSEVAMDRLRISREMHDILGHRLSLMVLHATAAATAAKEPEAQRMLAKVAEDGNQSIQDLHYVIGLLRQPDQTPASEVPALSASIHAARLEGLIVIEAIDRPLLSALNDQQRALLAIVAREALHNALKYAPGSHVTVSLARADRGAVLRIENDGTSRERAPIRPGGFGLSALAQQAASAGGSLDARYTPEGGFAVILRIPL
jgi:signal transduction histidine kinase